MVVYLVEAYYTHASRLGSYVSGSTFFWIDLGFPEHSAVGGFLLGLGLVAKDIYRPTELSCRNVIMIDTTYPIHVHMQKIIYTIRGTAIHTN